MKTMMQFVDPANGVGSTSGNAGARQSRSVRPADFPAQGEQGDCIACGMVKRAGRLPLVLALFVATGSRGMAESPHLAQNSPAAPVRATLFRDIARRQNPAVVSIMARARVHVWNRDELDVFRLFGVPPPAPGAEVRRVFGSGFLISAAGEILTNNHVIEGADVIDVSLFGDDRKTYRAVLVGRDPVTDSALIRLQNPPSNLQAATLGDSRSLEPGDWVMAIGNPFQLGHTVTVGFVSFEGRRFQMVGGRWEDMIQTDASINPGNSGGPLINVRGEVVGINVAIVDDDSGSNIGIGFAVPINSVKALLPQLRKGGVVRGQLGARLHEGAILDDEARQLGLSKPCGALVMSVDGDSAAERSGLRAGDVIDRLDERPVADARDLLERVSLMPPGLDITLRIIRDGAPLILKVKVEAMPSETVGGAPSQPEPADDMDGLTIHEPTPEDRARLSIPSHVEGALIVDVVIDSPADDAELAVGDVIRAINRRSVHSAAEAEAQLRRIEPGQPIFLLVWRHGREALLRMRKG
jgi:serine protease Do